MGASSLLWWEVFVEKVGGVKSLGGMDADNGHAETHGGDPPAGCLH